MILKIQQTASEHQKKSLQPVPLNKMTHSLLDHKIEGLTKGYLIPDSLITELEYYIERNSLTEIPTDKGKDKVYNCCPRCLKAHMLKTADKMGLDEKGKKFLSLFLKHEEIGHDGYYLDNDALVRL